MGLLESILSVKVYLKPNSIPTTKSGEKFVFIPKTLVFMINYKSKSTHKKLILKNLKNGTYQNG